MELMVWESVAVGNACRLEGVENVDSLDLVPGIVFGKSAPTNIRLRMSKFHKKDTGLTDDLTNDNHLKVCSSRVVEFLKKRNLQNLEFLPVTILDHKGKAAGAGYCIVHPAPPQDALDVKASQPTYSPILKTRISRVKQLVVDTKRVEPGVGIFRLKSFSLPVFIDRALAAEMQKEAFVGSVFTELDEYE